MYYVYVRLVVSHNLIVFPTWADDPQLDWLQIRQQSWEMMSLQQWGYSKTKSADTVCLKPATQWGWNLQRCAWIKPWTPRQNQGKHRYRLETQRMWWREKKSSVYGLYGFTTKFCSCFFFPFKFWLSERDLPRCPSSTGQVEGTLRKVLQALPCDVATSDLGHLWFTRVNHGRQNQRMAGKSMGNPHLDWWIHWKIEVNPRIYWLEMVPSGKLTVGPWKWPIYSGFTSLPKPICQGQQVNLPEMSIHGCVWKWLVAIVPNGFADHYPYEKWLFHWEIYPIILGIWLFHWEYILL